MPYSHIPNVFTLGPAGTFSDQAAKQVCSNFEAIHYTRNFNEAIVRVAETPNSVAVVPIENSVATPPCSKPLPSFVKLIKKRDSPDFMMPLQVS